MIGSQVTLTEVFAQFQRNKRMNAVAVAGAPVAQATTGFLDTDPAVFAATLLATYALERPYLHSYVATANGTDNVEKDFTVTGSRWLHKVYGAMVDVNASSTISLAGMSLTVTASTPWGDSLANVITIDPPVPDGASGIKSVRIFVFGGMNLNGIYHYAPYALNNQFVATELPAHSVKLTLTAPPSGVSVSMSLLTRGHPQVDELIRQLTVVTQ